MKQNHQTVSRLNWKLLPLIPPKRNHQILLALHMQTCLAKAAKIGGIQRDLNVPTRVILVPLHKRQISVALEWGNIRQKPTTSIIQTQLPTKFEDVCLYVRIITTCIIIARQGKNRYNKSLVFLNPFGWLSLNSSVNILLCVLFI